MDELKLSQEEADMLDDLFHDKVLNEKYSRKVSDLSDQLICRALTHFCFRMGPIEGMHGEGVAIYQKEMKILNKFAMNRFAYLVSLVRNDRWIEIYTLIQMYGVFGGSWDEAVPDDGKVKLYLWKNFMNQQNHREES